MAVIAINETKGDLKEVLAQYDRVRAAEIPPGEGLIAHSCIELEDGIRVENVFQTEEEARAWYKRPEFVEVLRNAGVPEPTPTFYRLHNYPTLETS